MDTSSRQGFRLVQLTDLHLGAARDFRLADIPTLHSFTETLHFAMTELAPDHLILSGDLAADCEDGAYRLLAEVLGTTTVPVSCLPGNHDDPARLSRYFPCHDRELMVNGWRLLLLDTQVAGSVAGNLGSAGLQLVEQSLNRFGSQPDSRSDLGVVAPPTLVFMHHPPLSVDCAWLDRHQVASGPKLLELLAASPAVKAVFTGHVHQNGRFPFGHFAVHTTPSTCFQFTPGSREFSIDERPPGLRVIDLYPGGRFETEVIYLQGYPFRPQSDSSGY